VVDYQELLSTVAEFAETDRDAAERAVRATLQTLGERIAPGEAADLAAELPPEASAWLATTTPADPFDVEEFLRRVATRAELDPPAAERHATGVFVALARAVSGKELDDLMAELPREYERLLPRGRPYEVPSLDVFLGKAAERAGLDRAGARQATEAVLETLAERIAGGEVDDLVDSLPAELRPPLERGKQATGGDPLRMPADEFLKRVADRERVDLDLAARHTRAVLATLHDQIPDSEFHDVVAQLPHEYDALLARG
jgi:uncharacterized protein (DUF2267 family)